MDNIMTLKTNTNTTTTNIIERLRQAGDDGVVTAEEAEAVMQEAIRSGGELEQAEIRQIGSAVVLSEWENDPPLSDEAVEVLHSHVPPYQGTAVVIDVKDRDPLEPARPTP
jgi:hypothetical protein